jgi:hypothetical protein
VDQIQELVASVILLKASQVGVIKNFGCNFYSQVTAAGAQALSVYILFVSYTLHTNHLSCRTHTYLSFPYPIHSVASLPLIVTLRVLSSFGQCQNVYGTCELVWD